MNYILKRRDRLVSLHNLINHGNTDRRDYYLLLLYIVMYIMAFQFDLPKTHLYMHTNSTRNFGLL